MTGAKALALLGRVAVAAALGPLGVLAGSLARLRRAREARRAENEARYRRMIEESVLGVLIHQRYVPVYCNRAFARLLGFDGPHEVLALRSTEELYAPGERARMRGYQKARLSEGQSPSQYQFQALCKDGSVIVLETAVHLTRWNGEPATQHNVIDITHRVRAAQLLRESEARYRTLVEHAPEAILVLDVDARRCVDANDKALALLGVTREQLLGEVAAPDPPGPAAARCCEELFRRARDRKQPEFEWALVDAAGETVLTEVRMVRLPSTTGTLVRASVTDVSAHRAVQHELARTSRQLMATLENIDQGISMIDADLRVVEFNQRFLELLDFPADQFQRGDPFEKLVRYKAEQGEYGPGDPDILVAERMAMARRFEAHRFTRVRRDGRVLEVHGKPLPGGGIVTTYTDITERHVLSRRLSHQATHDPLTNLLNRREFEQHLDETLGELRRSPSEHALCYVDLDQFKVINDTCGHAAGDELLRQIASVLRTRIGEQDVFARLGGDEFGVLLIDADAGRAREMAGDLVRTVEEFRFQWRDRTFRVGASIGMVPLDASSGTVEDVLSAADAACYAAKDRGRNRVHVYCDDDRDLARRQSEMRWVVQIQDALEEERLELHLQPVLPVHAPAAAGGERYELLLRLRQDDGSLVAPGMFLPAAERYNLMGRLDRWVVRAALAALGRHGALLEATESCAINLSGQSIGDPGFLEFVVGELAASDVPADRICFEITETAAIGDLDGASGFMRALKGLGCTFALDDFGSGLSSFAYLKALPVDYLKIDGSFVKDIVDDPVDRAMVRAINEVARVMGKRTIAEFVENDAILAELGAIGVDYAQGYGLGRPAPLADVASRLAGAPRPAPAALRHRDPCARRRADLPVITGECDDAPCHALLPALGRQPGRPLPAARSRA